MTTKVTRSAEHHVQNLKYTSPINRKTNRKHFSRLKLEPCSEQQQRITDRQSPTLLRRDSYSVRGSFGFLIMKL